VSLGIASGTIGALLSEAEATLSAAGVDSPRADAEWLLAGLLGVGRARLAASMQRSLGGATAAVYEEAVRRRARREPLQRILGWEDFRGLRFALTPHVLIPRPETELLVECVLAVLPAPVPGRRPHVIDVGTGSGCIACALAHERRDVDVTAVDLSEVSIAVARANAQALGVAVRWVVADLVTATTGASVDVVVANLPYVPEALIDVLAPEVAYYEPRRALAGGADGLDLVRRLVPEASRVLRAGGSVVLETLGPEQAHAVAALLAGAQFLDVVARADLAGITRFVTGRRP
jgi:release factor glutamine methyltransferase